MLLEIVHMILFHLLSSLFSKLKGHDNKFDTYLSIILFLAKLCKNTKREIEIRIGHICQCYKGIISLNVIAFT